MISPTLSKKKESYHRRLQSARYKASLKHLKQDTSALRRSYERKNPITPEDDIQYYRDVEEDCLKEIRNLILPSHIESRKRILSEVSQTYKLNGETIDFTIINLSTVEKIEYAMNFEDIKTMVYQCEAYDEDYSETRLYLNKIFKTKNAFPLFEDLPYDIDVYVGELEKLDAAFHTYVEHFYKVYLHYKSKFEQAHEMKRVLLSKETINRAVVNDTLFLYVLVHGEISYEGNDLVMMESPMNVHHLMHSTPGCVFFSSGHERRLYDKVNLYIKQNKSQNSEMIRSVIKSTIPMMSAVNDKVKKDTMKMNQTRTYVRNYIIHHKSAPHVFHTAKGALVNNKNFSFELNYPPLQITKKINIEGLKVIHSRNIEDTIDLVDYLKLTINEENQIVFTLNDIMQILDNVKHLVMIDASCQTSIHTATKTFANYSRRHS